MQTSESSCLDTQPGFVSAACCLCHATLQSPGLEQGPCSVHSASWSLFTEATHVHFLHFMAAVPEIKHAFVCRPNYTLLSCKVYNKHPHLFPLNLSRGNKLSVSIALWVRVRRAAGAAQRLAACSTSSSCLLSSVQPLLCGARTPAWFGCLSRGQTAGRHPSANVSERVSSQLIF